MLLIPDVSTQPFLFSSVSALPQPSCLEDAKTVQALLTPRLDGCKLADLASWSTATVSLAVAAALLGTVKQETSSCRVLLHDVMMSRPPGWRRLCTHRMYSACLLWPSSDKPMASKVPLSVTTLYLH